MLLDQVCTKSFDQVLSGHQRLILVFDIPLLMEGALNLL
jgi:hypothetical protein